VVVRTCNAGDAVEVRFWDNGGGVPLELRDKDFTPFFTTKPAGEGTGLGLWTSYDIVVQMHKGSLRVESKEGRYAEFIVTLPKRPESRKRSRRQTAQADPLQGTAFPQTETFRTVTEDTMDSRRNLIRPFDLSLALAFLLVAADCIPAQAPSPPLPDRPLRLADCLAISEERQPSLSVARARLAAAQSKLAALESLDGPVVRLRQDLPLRRQQAQLGIEAAQANLARMEAENQYVGTRGYLSVLYVRAQRNVLTDLIDDLTYLRERVRTSVEKKERPEWTVATVDLITLYLKRAEARRAEADRGVSLALAAVREALALPPTVCLTIADEPIPQPAVHVCREDILAAAAARRGEVIMANLASEATVLETDVQATRCRRGAVNTFAAAADLHAIHVSQPLYGEVFRPGGVPLAMPDVLIGPRASRVETAQNYSVEAAAVAEKTRNLALLEAEEAYYQWEEWSRKVVFLGEAQKIGTRLGTELHEEFRGSLKRFIQAILPESLLAAQTRTDYNEALFRQAIALAALERVTGGAFCAGLVNEPPPFKP
jgi:hypothetical protein